MKGFGRAFEINCLFLLVVALLVALQLVLQRSHYKEILLQLKERGEEGEGGEGHQHQDTLPLPAPHHHPSSDNPPPDRAKSLARGGGGDGKGGAADGDGNLAAPIVPNIFRSFPKRKAPYVRRAKKNKKKKKNRKGKQQQQQREMRGGGEGVAEERGSDWLDEDDGVNDIAQHKGYKQKRGRISDKTKV